MKNLYIDFDGVVLNTIGPLYKDMDEKLGKNSTEQERRTYISNYNWESILTDENIINDGIECIKKIIKSEKFNISILTHINSLNEGVLKINYIRKYFKDITVILCPKEISKTKMVHTKDSILIDDYSGNLREWKSEDGVPVKFSLETESDEFIKIERLDKIIELF